MKTLPFTKLTGAGNDFIIIDERKGINYRALAKKVCDRTNGLGADGLIVLCKSRKADYRMRIFNPDGSEAEMCGNGVRCLAVYIKKFQKPAKKLFSIEAIAGILLAEAVGEVAHVRLSEPKDFKREVSVSIHKRTLHMPCIDTGVPHAIVFVEGLEQVDVQVIGEQIRFHKAFAPRGTNVNFVEIATPNCIHVRTYERGVEAETKACGTGSVAAALMAYFHLNPDVVDKEKALMKVRTRNGDILEVRFAVKNREPIDVWLKGPAKFVAEGKYFIN